MATLLVIDDYYRTLSLEQLKTENTADDIFEAEEYRRLRDPVYLEGLKWHLRGLLVPPLFQAEEFDLWQDHEEREADAWAGELCAVEEGAGFSDLYVTRKRNRKPY